MAEKKYIERERIEKFFDGIYDCADLVFEPNDHCCASDDCGHCKWYEAKEAIQKRILSIPAADVRPVVLCRDCIDWIKENDKSGFGKCALMRSPHTVYSTKSNWFCADGKKREES